jgi:hypothetical protein
MPNLIKRGKNLINQTEARVRKGGKTKNKKQKKETKIKKNRIKRNLYAG